MSFIDMDDTEEKLRPQLPEGYREEGKQLLFEGEVIAAFDSGFLPSVGLLFLGGYEQGEASMPTEHAQALAIWLQRRVSE